MLTACGRPQGGGGQRPDFLVVIINGLPLIELTVVKHLIKI